MTEVARPEYLFDGGAERATEQRVAAGPGDPHAGGAVAAIPGLASGEGTARRSGPHDPADPLGGTELPGSVVSVLQRRASRGRTLPSDVAASMGEQFGADFSQVRVHHDPEAAHIARAVQADAFTFGSDLYFASGRFDPGSPAGQRLLAHELAHVVQATAGPPSSGAPTIGRADDPAETAADQAAHTVVSALQRHAAARPVADHDHDEPQAAGQVLSALRRQASSGPVAEVDHHAPDAAHAHRHSHPHATLRRHGSPEHLALGNIGPRDLRKIPDAKALLAKIGLAGMRGKNNVKHRRAVREAIHVVMLERQRIRDWQSSDAGRGDKTLAEKIFDVKIVSLDNDLRSGAAEPTDPVLATYGELNTLADYFGSLDDLYAISNETVFKVLQTEREDYYTYLGSLFKELTAQDCVIRYEQVPEVGPVPVAYYRPESWYEANLDQMFGDEEGFTVRSGERLTEQDFDGTQSGLLTAGVSSYAAGMHGIDTVVGADEGTKKRGTGGVWGATARNACHFAPQSWYYWKDHHEKARTLALAAYQGRQKEGEGSAEEADAAENEAWLNNGFGDHYLQDSFAAGHLINKTLVMQWYIEYIHANWSLFGPSKEEWARLMSMSTVNQPNLGGRDLYSKDVSLGPSGPQAITGSETAEDAFDKADLVNPLSTGAEQLVRWWRAQWAMDDDKQTMRRSELLKAPGASPAIVDEVVGSPFVLDEGATWGSYVPIFGTDDRLYKLNESPHLEMVKASKSKRARGKNYNAGRAITYAAYTEFLKNSLIQSGSGDLHNYFCLNGLDVQNDENRTVFKIYGDYVMLNAGGGAGVEISAETAEMSRSAIADIARDGRTDISVSDIMVRFPSKVALPDKIFGEAVPQTGGTKVDGKEILPLEDWHDQLRPFLVKIFAKGTGTFKDRAVVYVASMSGDLAPADEVVPHAGAEF